MKVIIGLGSNAPRAQAYPDDILKWACEQLETRAITPVSSSTVISSRPMGPPNQPVYVNQVILTSTHKPPMALLRACKQIERQAGRRGGRRWGARALDIDIIDYAGLVRGWASVNTAIAHEPGHRTGLILPHPGAHKRDFVLRPLAELWPDWKHPVLHVRADTLLARLPARYRYT